MSLRSSIHWLQQDTLSTADLFSPFPCCKDAAVDETPSDSETATSTRFAAPSHTTPPPSTPNNSSNSYLYIYPHQTSPYFLMRRASTSARRRLGSADHKGSLTDLHNINAGVMAVEHAHNNYNNDAPRSFRSRSQERSLLTRKSVKQQHEEMIVHMSSQASSTAGDSDVGLDSEGSGSSEYLLDRAAEGHYSSSTTSTTTAKVLCDGVVSRNTNQVILTPPPKQQPLQRKTSHKHTNGTSPSRVPRTPKFHRRAQSDPFDVSGLEGTDTTEILLGSDDLDDPLLGGTVASLPTLPRYPVAATRDLNCWSEPPLSIFKVRGAHYLKDKKKVASAPYLMRPRGCDLFLFADDASPTQPPPTMMERSSSLLNGTLRNDPTLVLNFRFPWGLMLLYFEIPVSMAPFLKHVPAEQCYRSGNHAHKTQQPAHDRAKIDALLKTLSPGERTLALWIMGDTHYKNQRLKLIPYVVQGPWVVRNLVTGRPAIIGTKLPVSYQCQDSSLLVVELDIGNSSNTAKRIVSLCRRYMNALTCDIGFVIQGNTAEELPEQMLGSIRIHGIDPLKAPTFV